MPGAYAHITMVNFAKEPARLEALGFSGAAGLAVSRYFKYIELGAVSPDYPYLAIGDGGAAKWADLMHYERTGQMITTGISAVAALDGAERERAFAWLLGYSAHVTTDVTIHPVVELKVGPYASNKKGHRVCEMHQDSYLWGTRMNLGPVGVSEHLSSGIARCVDGAGKVDGAVRTVWEHMLKTVHPTEAAANAPNVDRWHAGFAFLCGQVASKGHKLFPIARHVAANQGLTYPDFHQVDRPQYIDKLDTPKGEMTYDAVFDRARDNVGKAWSALERAVFKSDTQAFSFFGDWNLDTGRDAADRLVFWS